MDESLCRPAQLRLPPLVGERPEILEERSEEEPESESR
jgi:hypothetical protein